MKLEETLEDNEVEQIKDDDQPEDIEFGIDKEDEWVIFKSFTNYSDPAGSIVREIASNSFDAHIEADVDRPVDITITEENDLLGTSSVISFRDYGTGMSPDIIRNIYSKFGKSTKRDRDDAIGAFGFGAKSPLAYQDMFDLITIHDGIRYHYSIHAGERTPKITLMDESETDEPSGTDVRINIDDGDKHKFVEALKTNLRYFDNINYHNCEISNDYTIIRGKHFIYRLDKNKRSKYRDDQDLHLCLGKVYYPMSSKLIGRYTMNVGLRFDIGEIPVVWNRENVEYTDKAVKKIKEKVKLAQKELQSIYDQQYSHITSIDELLKYQDIGNLVPLMEEDDQKYGIHVHSKFIDTKATYPKYEHLKVKPNSNLYNPFKLDKAYGSGYMSTNFYSFDPKGETIVLMDKGESHSEMKTEYLKDQHDSVYFLRIRNRKKAVKDLLNDFFARHFASEPYEYNKQERQEAIQEAYDLYDEMVDFIKQNSIDYTNVQISDEFEKEFIRKKEAEKKRKKEIFHFLRVKTSGSFNRTRINGERLPKKFGQDTVIYGFQDDRPILKEVKGIIEKEYNWRDYQYIHVIQISMRNERVVKEVLPDTAFYVQNVQEVPAIRRISGKYNKKAWINELIDSDIPTPPLSRHSIPRYIDPEEPTLQEKNEVYAKLGEYYKYPLLHYVNEVRVPDERIQEYKEQCKYHHVNPILIGKKHIHDYEN